MKTIYISFALALFSLATASAASPTTLFEEEFSADLSNWIGRFDANHHGKITVDPLNPTNRVLTFTATAYSGDIFSLPIDVSAYDQVVLSFDYLGLGAMQNLGGFVGFRLANIDVGAWVAGTDQSAANGLGFEGIQIVDDSHWHSYTVDLTQILRANHVSQMQLFLEDWADAGGPGAGDAFFDNIKVVATPSDSLVAFFPFDGNANDLSGHGNNGSVSGAVLTTNRFGVPNSAYYFPGDGSYISVPDSPSLHFGTAATVCVWINFQEGGKDSPRILTKPTGIIDFGLTDHSAEPQVFFGFLGVGQVISPRVSADQWLFLAGVYDGSSILLYTNGIMAAQKNFSGSPSVTATSFTIGRNLETGGDSLKGIIDDVRIFDRALGQSEILGLFQQPTSCTPHRATAIASVVNGFVVGINITDSGCGYTNAPLVQLVGSNGTGATAVAKITNGIVTSITVTDAGTGYITAPNVLIASPPFAPYLDIAVSKVKVTQHVVLGKNYILESSNDLANWTTVGTQFTAQDEALTREFDVESEGRYYRIRQVP